MADNIGLVNPSNGTAGNTVATDEIASVHHQLVKIEFGADSSATMVSATNPLPVVNRNSSGTEIGTIGSPFRVDPTGTTAQPVYYTAAPSIVLSGTGAVNVAQYNGSAVGATNALHVQPGTGASFSVVGGFTGAQPVTVSSGNINTVGGFSAAQPVTVSGSVPVGYSAIPTILVGGYTATPTVALASTTVLGVGYSSAQTLGVGFTSGAVLGVGFTSTPTVTTNPHSVGVTGGTMAVGFSAGQTIATGFSSAQTLGVGYSSAQTLGVGFSSGQTIAVGYTSGAALGVGFTSGAVLGVGASAAAGILTQGAAASGASVSGNPIYNGGRASNVNPTAVANGQAVGLMADLSGKLVSKIGATREMFTQGETTLTASTTETTLIASAGASLYWDIDKLIIDNTGTSPAIITLRDQTGGGNAYHFQVPCTAGPVGFSNPIPLHQATANRSWSVQSDTSVSSIYVKFSASKNQ